MVVRITLNVKHIRGDTFQIDIDPEADTIGLKIQIWELRAIPVETQRLVFAGREIQDGVKLSQCGISDGATIFLVESNFGEQYPNQPIPQPQPLPAYPPIVSEGDIIQPPMVAVNIPASINRGYEPLDQESQSEQKIGNVIDLAYWIRFYCITCMILSILSVFHCKLSFIPFAIYLIGWIGTRKLNRCCLVFPLLLTTFIGFVGTAATISWMVHDFYPIQIVFLFVSILHLCIFPCIYKLICLINRLNDVEFTESRRRIRSRSFCC